MTALPGLLAMAFSVIAVLMVGRTAVLQVREFRARTQEDAMITRILGLEFHAPVEITPPSSPQPRSPKP